MDKCEKIVNKIVIIGISILFVAMLFMTLIVIDFIREVKYHPCINWTYQDNQVYCLERLDLTDK